MPPRGLRAASSKTAKRAQLSAETNIIADAPSASRQLCNDSGTDCLATLILESLPHETTFFPLVHAPLPRQRHCVHRLPQHGLLGLRKSRHLQTRLAQKTRSVRPG